MFPDMHWLYIKKRKALQYKAFRISNHPCFDKKVRNTGGVQFVLFTTVRSADFPLFPSSPVRFFRILGQNWVKGEKRNWMLIL